LLDSEDEEFHDAVVAEGRADLSALEVITGDDER